MPVRRSFTERPATGILVYREESSVTRYSFRANSFLFRGSELARMPHRMVQLAALKSMERKAIEH